MKNDCIIIGGGASGLMLAAMTKVNKGVILEATPAVGTKLLMTGGGRCNITHGGSIKDFVDCYDEAGRVLRKCLYRHSNTQMLEWLENIGLPVVEIDERYYPASEKAADVKNVLVSSAIKNGWEIKTNAKVTGLEKNGDCWDVAASGQLLNSEKVVIATGGITYPETGSDGSIFPILKQLGIRITELRPALAPVYVRDYPYGELSGISLENVTVAAFATSSHTCKGKAARVTGDILFTHNGFSGPAVLKLSKYCEPGEIIRLNYNCELNELPKRMAKLLENRARGESGDIKTSKLSALLEADDFIVDRIDEKGIVTSGGIDLSEIDAGTMEIKRCPGLFAIGEALDADGTTGGYNLQLCYSTAATVKDAIWTQFKIL